MLNSSIWRAVLSLFYPPVIIQGKNGKNSESPVGSNKSEKRKPKSAVYRSILASVVYFHIRLISTRRHKREMTRNQVVRKGSWVRIPPLPPENCTVTNNNHRAVFQILNTLNLSYMQIILSKIMLLNEMRKLIYILTLPIERSENYFKNIRIEDVRLKHCNLSTIPKKGAQNQAP